MNDWRERFPVFSADPGLVYLDSAATTHKPQAVIDAVAEQLAFGNGSPNRGAHRGSVTATRLYREAKETVARFTGARSAEEIVFVKNATEALNLVGYGFALAKGRPGGNIVVSITSHHSNLLPWQMACERTGMELRFLRIEPDGGFTAESTALIDENTLLVALPVVSNAYGMRHPVEAVTAAARAVGAVVVLDGAQAAGHLPIDVTALDCDFFVFSGHKLYAPQGIGVLYGKRARLEEMTPFLRGGDMIEYVTEQGATFAPVPERLEAGTQPVTGAHALRAAVEFIESIGLPAIAAHEHALVARTLEAFAKLPWIHVIGPATAEGRGSIVAFTVDGIHPHDVASILDERGIAIRAGHHCCQPLMAWLGVPASCRASFGAYNRPEDVDALVGGLKTAREVFGLGA